MLINKSKYWFLLVIILFLVAVYLFLTQKSLSFKNNPKTRIYEKEQYTFNLDLKNAEGETYIKFIELPEWLSYNFQNKIIAGLAGNQDIGIHNVEVWGFNTTNDTVKLAYTIEVMNRNDPPSFSNDPPDGYVDSFYQFHPVTHDEDINNQLTIRALTIPNWLQFNEDNNVLTGTPTTNDTGTQKLVLRVHDGLIGIKKSWEISIYPGNTPPEFTSKPITSAQEDNDYEYFIEVTDIDNDFLIISVPSKPEWLYFNDKTNRLSGTPKNNDVGRSHVSIEATDSQSDEPVVQNYYVSVGNTNDPPKIISKGQNWSISQNEQFEYIIEASDEDHGDSLIYIVVNKPDWLQYDESSHKLTGTPTEENRGSHPIHLKVADVQGSSAELEFTINIDFSSDIQEILNFKVVKIDQIDEATASESYMKMQDLKTLFGEIKSHGLEKEIFSNLNLPPGIIVTCYIVDYTLCKELKNGYLCEECILLESGIDMNEITIVEDQKIHKLEKDFIFLIDK